MNKQQQQCVIVLFRQDLRLADNPALTHACQLGVPIIPLYILDDQTPEKWKMGPASRWWLHHSLRSLQMDLQGKGSQLFFFKGSSLKILSELIRKYHVQAVYWNRCYEPYNRELEEKIKQLSPNSQSFNASLLFEPCEILNKEQKPFRVFSAFWNTCLKLDSFEKPFGEPLHIATKMIDGHSLNSLELLQRDFKAEEIGEKAAHKKLNHFVAHGLSDYLIDRDFPAKTTSSLSAHLHFGEIGPRQIVHKVKHHNMQEKFLSELGWREFCYSQLYHFPKLAEEPLRKEFSYFPWEQNEQLLQQWKEGQTGFPIVDAGMRQLFQTGFMHNRVRMICASFLVKDLFIPWQEGAKWFWETLFDADLANNSANWQWIAGCGLDAAPFFRIFNPTIQSQKFDPEGIYIKKWVPELRDVSKKFIHMPWKSPEKLSYPDPIVEHEKCRIRALEAFKKSIKKG